MIHLNAFMFYYVYVTSVWVANTLKFCYSFITYNFDVPYIPRISLMSKLKQFKNYVIAFETSWKFRQILANLQLEYSMFHDTYLYIVYGSIILVLWDDLRHHYLYRWKSKLTNHSWEPIIILQAIYLTFIFGSAEINISWVFFVLILSCGLSIVPEKEEKNIIKIVSDLISDIAAKFHVLAEPEGLRVV